jgi:hypothetical protein
MHLGYAIHYRAQHRLAGRRRPTFGTLRALYWVLGISFESLIAFRTSWHEDAIGRERG